MKKLMLLPIVGLLLISCGSTKSYHTKNTTKADKAIIGKGTTSQITARNIKPKHTADNPYIGELAEEEDSPWSIKQGIIAYAKTFQGTKYRYGGTTDAGMDCSGLVCTAFQKENISLPRISRDMATKGIAVSLEEISEGDLVFFKTSRKNQISHVGLVVTVEDGIIKFIHSTTRAGVIISSMDEPYWKKAFVEGRRVI